MIAQVWKTSVLFKEKLLGKYQIDIEIKNKKPIPKNLFSLKITKHLKTNRWIFLALKTLFKTCKNTSEN